MDNLLWIGSYLNDEMALKMRDIGYENFASILSQKNILEGIEEVTGNRFNTINALALNGYPREHVKYFRKRVFSHASGISDTLVGFLNIKYMNKLLMGISLKKEVRKHLLSNATMYDDVFIYEMRSACLKAAKEVKMLLPSSKIHLIVPDLPQFMDLRSNKFKKLLKRFDWMNIRRNMRYVDDYVLYAEPMAEFLGLKSGSWIVMEGAIDQTAINDPVEVEENRSSNRFIVMYSGSINEGFGIQKLLDATRLLDESYEFWFTGGGDYKDVVKSYAEKDTRIKYFGYLPQFDDVKKLQSKASVLINMRDPEVIASKYCFPSKIFEYMITGKPVISCRLPGVPAEYYNYLIEMNALTPVAIADSVKKVSEMTNAERIMLGKKERKFIMQEKNKLVQAEKIVKYTIGK